ncbi:MAG: hypothetical protein F6K54_05750 [Okeania sp. SIO3B5]|uniref:hypothetical protein n=1 Tax=Okeania sp. SIO3B5 TaxID=2607811 RepID=UPI0013FE98BF|nr:hypothetical protein [Okeania sp. SIO3B5]NEO52621.1 hypothetical protein [Okeania sp. SIO3B5]
MTGLTIRAVAKKAIAHNKLGSSIMPNAKNRPEIIQSNNLIVMDSMQLSLYSRRELMLGR